jgi:5-hydroxyisourate hydrolase-like protein (transthyretin family)
LHILRLNLRRLAGSLRSPVRLAVMVIFVAGTASALAATVTGVVTNKTTGKPAAGDTVTLIQLAQGMQEAGQTKTDAHGRYKLDLPDDGVHLVRVTHDKANYFEPVTPGSDSVDVAVYSAAAKVDGVVSEAAVLHVESAPGSNALTVVENFFVKNASTPPKTQFSDRPFEFYLPPDAVVEGSDAVGPGKMAMRVKSPPVPLGEPGHYAMIFPLRPCPGKEDAESDKDCGETRFQVTYRLPYKGSMQLSPRVATPTGALVVMLPKSMTFTPGSATPYAPVNEPLSSQAYVAQNVTPEQAVDFTVGGTGQMPRDSQVNANQTGDSANTGSAGASSNLTPSEASARQRADSKPGVGLNNPLDSDAELEPWAKYRGWILGALVVALAGGAGVMLKTNPAKAVAGAGGGQSAASYPETGQPFMPGPPSPDEHYSDQPNPARRNAAIDAVSGQPVGRAPGDGALLQALKDELFALETERLEGRLGEAQYIEQRAALDIVLRRALGRRTAGSVEGADA